MATKLKKIPVTPRAEFDSPSIQPPSYPPDFHIGDKQMPEIKKWEQDGKYRLVVDVVMKTRNESDDGVDGRFELVAYKYIPAKTLDELEGDELHEYGQENLT